LTTAGAAAEAGLTTEEIDDVKIAVDELCSLVMAVAAESDRLRLTFLANENGITIEAAGPSDGELEIDDLARAILDATVDKLELDDSTLGVGFRLTKHRSGG
jgi:serine/threonine-protein kinase RsbW